MFCVKCGKELPEGARFCTGCGQPVPEAKQATPVVEEKPVEAKAPVVEEKPVEVAAPVVEEKPVETKAPVVEEKPVEAAAPVVEEKPVEVTAPVAEEKPVETAAPVVEEKPVAQEAPVQPEIPVTPVVNQAPVYEQATPATPVAPVASTTESVKKKSSGKKIAAMIAIVVVAACAVVGITAHAQISNFVRRTFSGAKSYFDYVVEKNLDEKTDDLKDGMDLITKSMSSTDQSKKLSCKVELGESLKTMLSMTGIDFSKFQSAQFDVLAKMKDKVASVQANVLVNDQNALTLNSYVDLAMKELYIQIPELTASYLNASSSLADFDGAQFDTAMQSLDKVKEFIPDSDDVVDMYKRYAKIILKNVKDVSKTSNTIKASDISQGCTELVATCKGKEMYAILKDVITELKDDKVVLDTIKKYDESAADSYKESIEQVLAGMESQKATIEESDVKMTIHLYVNGEGIIVGSKAAIDIQGQAIEVSCLAPTDGNDFGFQMGVEYNGVSYFTIDGKGTRKGGKLDGTYSLSMDDSLNKNADTISSLKDIVKVEVKDFDLDKMKEGYLNGTVKLSSQAIPTIAPYALSCEFKSDKKKTSCAVSVLSGSEKFATLTFAAEDAQVSEVKKPGDSDKVYDTSNSYDVQSYAAEIDITKFLTELQTKSGLDLSSIIAAAQSSMTGTTGLDGSVGTYNDGTGLDGDDGLGLGDDGLGLSDGSLGTDIDGDGIPDDDLTLPEDGTGIEDDGSIVPDQGAGIDTDGDGIPDEGMDAGLGDGTEDTTLPDGESTDPLDAVQ